jgi:hypothetical protein
VNYDVGKILPEFADFQSHQYKWYVSDFSGTKVRSSWSLNTTCLTGVFLLLQKSFDKVDISGGLRFDTRSEDGFDLYTNAEGERVDAYEAGSIKV